MAYDDTHVPVSRSQEGIRVLLSKYKASGVQFEENWDDREVAVRFLYKVKEFQYVVRIRTKIPEVDRIDSRYSWKEASGAVIQKREDQANRTIWRALFWAIKSRMEAVEFGIETFQSAFLAHFEIPGEGKTVGEYIIPRLESGRLLLADAKELK